MGNPVDPSLIFGRVPLPKARDFDHWKVRTVCRLLGRLSETDFDFGFDTVVKWADGRPISPEQAAASAFDIMIATTGVGPGVIVQKCEDTGTVLLTVMVRAEDGKVQHKRTRTIALVDNAPAKPVKLKRRA